MRTWRIDYFLFFFSVIETRSATEYSQIHRSIDWIEWNATNCGGQTQKTESKQKSVCAVLVEIASNIETGLEATSIE